jgi:hypothetical protein
LTDPVEENSFQNSSAVRIGPIPLSIYVTVVGILDRSIRLWTTAAKS